MKHRLNGYWRTIYALLVLAALVLAAGAPETLFD